MSGGFTSGRTSAATWIVLVALTYGTWQQGAFYRGPFLVVLLLAAVAVAAVLSDRGARSAVGPLLARLAAVLGAAVALNVALTPATWSSAAPTMALVLVVLAGIGVGASADEAAADRLALGLVVVAAIVATTAWVGLALHHEPWAIVVQDLWRGASSLTYANATATLAGVGLVLGLARLVRRPELLTFLATLACAVGVLGAASRAGWLSAAVGLLVLGRSTGFAALARVAVVVGAAAGVAWLGLLPSLDAGSRAHAGLAVAAALVAAVGGWTALGRGGRRTTLALGAALALVGVAVLAGSGPWASRLTLRSDDRGDEWSAAADEVRDHPLLGTGAGQLELAWTTPDGRALRAEFVHNEYLELVATHGALGLAAFAAAGVVLWRRRRPEHDGALAALAVIGVHSAFDFVWHVPVIPLAAALLLGLCVRGAPATPQDGSDHDARALSRA